MQRYGTRDVIAAAAAYLVGVGFLVVFALSFYGIEGSVDGLFYVAALTFSFLFGAAVNRFWALWFPALHWIAYHWLWREIRTDLPVHYDVHPLESFSMVAIVIVAGIWTRRWVETRRRTVR
jgi:hypothetical protein